MKETKPFYKTSEFWLMIIGQVVLTLQTSDAITLMSQKYAWLSPIMQTLLAIGYILSRGQAKSGVPNTDESADISEFTQPTEVQAVTNLDTPVASTTP